MKGYLDSCEEGAGYLAALVESIVNYARLNGVSPSGLLLEIAIDFIKLREEIDLDNWRDGNNGL